MFPSHEVCAFIQAAPLLRDTFVSFFPIISSAVINVLLHTSKQSLKCIYFIICKYHMNKVKRIEAIGIIIYIEKPPTSDPCFPGAALPCTGELIAARTFLTGTVGRPGAALHAFLMSTHLTCTADLGGEHLTDSKPEPLRS